MSDLLNKAREYELKEHSSETPGNRPAFHITPMTGWMNDPNGFCYYRGQYHMFYQYHPYSKSWGPMHWGHVISDDLLHWRHMPAAIAPDTEADNAGCFSGSALETADGQLALIYTGVIHEKDKAGVEWDVQTQCLALGDGKEFSKYAGNPVIDRYNLPEGMSYNDFRDPKVWKNKKGSYSMIVSSRTDDGSGALLIYESEDLKQWTYVHELDRSGNALGRMWECPDYFELDGLGVVLMSPQDIIGDGKELRSGSDTVAVFGPVSEEARGFKREHLQLVDYGTDFYASQSTETPDGRRVMVGWLQNWESSSESFDHLPWFGQCTLPRELSLKTMPDGTLRLIQWPVRELESSRKAPVSVSNYKLNGTTTFPGISGRKLDMEISLQGIGEKPPMFVISLANNTSEAEKNQGIPLKEITLCYDPFRQELSMDRSRAGYSKRAFSQHCACKLQAGNRLDLRIVMDLYSIEVFANGGTHVMSMAHFTDPSSDGISFTSYGECILDINKYDIE